MTNEEAKCLTEYKKLFCTNCEADCTTSILDCNGYQFFYKGYEKGYEQGQKDKEYLDNTNLTTKSSMSVECAIAESQLGNYCIANRNKNPKVSLNNEPPEIQKLIDESAKFLAGLITKEEK